MAEFTRGFGPVSARTVADFERRCGVSLPDDYTSFLRTTNGGVPEPNGFTVPGCGDALADFLYGIQAERTAGDLEWEQEQATLWDPLPPGFVAIGHDPGNNKLLLGTIGEDAGRVFFWDRAGFWHTPTATTPFRWPSALRSSSNRSVSYEGTRSRHSVSEIASLPHLAGAMKGVCIRVSPNTSRP
jgi:hypothetical protein